MVAKSLESNSVEFKLVELEWTGLELNVEFQIFSYSIWIHLFEVQHVQFSPKNILAYNRYVYLHIHIMYIFKYSLTSMLNFWTF